MALNLYEEDGWINIPSISSLNTNFNILIGPRQVGKTYGTLKHLIYAGKKFIFMRRTPTELDTCLKGSTSTFQSLSLDCNFEYKVENDSQYIRRIDFYEPGAEKPFNSAIALALTSVSKIRGFSGVEYTDLVYDEFIPEVTVKRMRGEGDAFVNAYITINGNRELKGRRALRCWLLANSNDLYSPVLAELGLTEKVEHMVKKNQEYTYMEHRGCLIAMPRSEKITSKRRETALYRLTGTGTASAKMALDNDFSYNNFSDVIPMDLSEMNCIFEICGMFVWQGKVDKLQYYVCYKKAGDPKVLTTTSTRGLARELIDSGHADFIDLIYKGRVAYASYGIKRTILLFLNKPII